MFLLPRKEPGDVAAMGTKAAPQMGCISSVTMCFFRIGPLNSTPLLMVGLSCLKWFHVPPDLKKVTGIKKTSNKHFKVKF